MSRVKAPPDLRGGHVRLYWELVDSVAWRALSWADRGLYIAMRRKLLATNNGNIEATLGTLRHAGVTSSASLAKGLRALMTAGFIAKTRQGGVAYGTKVCSLYRFTDEPVFDLPKLCHQVDARHEGLDAVREDLRGARGTGRCARRRKAPKGRKHAGSENEPVPFRE